MPRPPAAVAPVRVGHRLTRKFRIVNRKVIALIHIDVFCTLSWDTGTENDKLSQPPDLSWGTATDKSARHWLTRIAGKGSRHPYLTLLTTGRATWCRRKVLDKNGSASQPKPQRR